MAGDLRGPGDGPSEGDNEKGQPASSTSHHGEIRGKPFFFFFFFFVCVLNTGLGCTIASKTDASAKVVPAGYQLAIMALKIKIVSFPKSWVALGGTAEVVTQSGTSVHLG